MYRMIKNSRVHCRVIKKALIVLQHTIVAKAFNDG